MPHITLDDRITDLETKVAKLETDEQIRQAAISILRWLVPLIISAIGIIIGVLLK